MHELVLTAIGTPDLRDTQEAIILEIQIPAIQDHLQIVVEIILVIQDRRVPPEATPATQGHLEVIQITQDHQARPVAAPIQDLRLAEVVALIQDRAVEAGLLAAVQEVQAEEEAEDKKHNVLGLLKLKILLY